MHKKLHLRRIPFQGLHYTFLDSKVEQFDLKATTNDLVRIRPQLSADALLAIKQLKLIPVDANAAVATADFKQSSAKVIVQLSRTKPSNATCAATVTPSTSTISHNTNLLLLLIQLMK